MDHWQNTEQREDKYGDHGGDHQQYLQQKRRKLDDQRRRTEGNWFAGCVVWIDGLTDPPADDLEQLVVAGGGLVCDSRDRRATHIVAVNMTAAQTKKLKARKRGFAKPAVCPQWVVDSAARRCRQDPGRIYCGGPLVLQMKRWPSCARGTTCGRRGLDLRLWKRLWMTRRRCRV
ncbi:unnamed protein product [Pelagomonas calceolata]|uniref:BRCT domain-containing protein n=1 Tax=Pelagomonas calceolata TaxID=35677 RepID=A0A8J2SR69_9STRA|nr:unnamed protein product [Pelagomonas calceolata]